MRTRNIITILLSITAPLALVAASFQSQFPEGTRTWVGADFWANRLQDWRVTMGRLECLEGRSSMPLRTVHWLTGDIAESGEAFVVSARTGTLGFESIASGSSFSGFLIGAGAGKLDYRGAALIHHFPGEGGGILAVFNDKGQAQFRRNDMESKERPALVTDGRSNAKARTGRLGNWEDYQLKLEVGPEVSGKRDLTLTVVETFTQERVSFVELKDHPSEMIAGGVALVSHGGEEAERRYWFRDFTASGSGLRYNPERQFGPVLGVLYSVDNGRLKLSAQFPPLGTNDSSVVTLQLRGDSGGWQEVGQAGIIAPSYTALFDLQLPQANSAFEYKYRVGYQTEGGTEWYDGRIPAPPKAGEAITVAGLTCYQNMARAADGSWGEGAYGSPPGRWIPSNVHYPHTAVVDGVKLRDPDLIALLGDQIYESGNPTSADSSEANPHLDYLYKWYLTLGDLGRITRNVPTVVLVDDHDVYQGDLWGDGGTPSRDGDNKAGGYVHEPEFINMVERTQTAANPEPKRRQEIKQGLTTYYATFQVADVAFALMEDRKFKSLPTMVGPVKKYGSKIVDKGYDGRDADIRNGQILGAEQEDFLREWIRQTDGVRVAFTQTLFASLHTEPSGELWLDLDSGGWPQTARNRALEVLAKGNVLLLSGDTHLPAVVHHGVKQFGDSVWQFVVPAIANKYRRWWQPENPGANRRTGDPYYTGDFFDGFGNRMTVAAVANPKVDNKEVFESNVKRDIGYASEHLLLDREQYRDGYGVLIISPDRKTVTFECWPAGTDVEQYEDWPVELVKDPDTGEWTRR